MNEIFQMVNQIKANPVQFLMQRKFNIPADLKDPNAIVNHLLQTGQVNQDAVNRAYQMARRYR